MDGQKNILEKKSMQLLHKFIKNGDLRGYFAYFNFVCELEKVFNCHIDVIMDGIEDKEFLNQINRDKKILYVRER